MVVDVSRRRYSSGAGAAGGSRPATAAVIYDDEAASAAVPLSQATPAAATGGRLAAAILRKSSAASGATGDPGVRPGAPRRNSLFVDEGGARSPMLSPMHEDAAASGRLRAGTDEEAGNPYAADDNTAPLASPLVVRKSSAASSVSAGLPAAAAAFMRKLSAVSASRGSGSDISIESLDEQDGAAAQASARAQYGPVTAGGAPLTARQWVQGASAPRVVRPSPGPSPAGSESGSDGEGSPGRALALAGSGRR
jgi:hypothetical protein